MDCLEVGHPLASLIGRSAVKRLTLGLFFFYFFLIFYSNEMPLCGEWRMLPPGQKISGVISTYTQRQKKKYLQPPALLSD